MIYIGIDPAFRDSGFTIAIIDTEDMTMNFKTFKNGFFDFIGWFLHESPENAVVAIENSNLQDTTFKVTTRNIQAFMRNKLTPKGKKVSETAPKGNLVRKDGTIKADGKEFLNKSQYASRNEKPAMLSDNMFYEGTPQVSDFDQLVYDTVYAKGGRVKKKPFAKRGFGRAYKRRK